MKNASFFVIILMVLLFGLAGCGKKNGTEPQKIELPIVTQQKAVKVEPAKQPPVVKPEPMPAKQPQKAEQMITGTVRYVELEGGFYELVADSGEKYDPLNLPAEYRNDGLRVKFQNKEKKGLVSFHMRGKIVEVVTIEKLE